MSRWTLLEARPKLLEARPISYQVGDVPAEDKPHTGSLDMVYSTGEGRGGEAGLVVACWHKDLEVWQLWPKK